MLQFQFLGTGCPVPSPVRAGPAHLVATEHGSVLIDCGNGVAQRLVAGGRRGADVEALIVTHYHSDHVADFWTLIVSSWHQGRPRPWRVFASAPALRHLRAQVEAYADEIALRIAHERRPAIVGLQIEFEELVPGRLPALAGLEIEAFEVDHRPVTPAFGLSFRAPEGRVVFSGDTAPVASLTQAARRADLLVQEVFVDREMQPTPGVRSAETVDAVRGYHTTPAQVAAIAREAGVGALAVTHLVPPAADRLALAAELREGFDGPVIVGEDLMTIDVGRRIVACRDVVVAY
jgi:ribonuclease Z